MITLPDPNELQVADPSGVIVGAIVAVLVVIALLLVFVIKTVLKPMADKVTSIDRQVNNVPKEHPSIQTQLRDIMAQLRDTHDRLVQGEAVLQDVRARQSKFEERWGPGGAGMDGAEFANAAALQEFLHGLSDDVNQLTATLAEHDAWERSEKYGDDAANRQD